jgi:uncharacterized membrane protein
MGNLSKAGRVFFGLAITVMGALTIYYGDFPYMLIPPKHAGIPGITILTYISGALLIVAGTSIFSGKKIGSVSLLLGGTLLLIFCFWFIPYQLLVSTNFIHFGDWENAAKELALAGGALVIAAQFSEKSENPLIKLLSQLKSLGVFIFSLTIISFGVDHYLYAKEAADYVPSWIPYHLFWIYFTGTALAASGFAIIIKIKGKLAATLLGAMTLTWFIILHIPRIIVSPVPYLGSEIASAFLALAYSGIAFVIAGAAKK